MDAVYFRNPGVIDLRTVRTFGVSAKTKDNPIGYFGTGLKYAIAILLREGHTIELYAGEKKHVFGAKNFGLRGKEFDQCTIDKKELPFTTELGKNWEIWQAFRELYCNVLDEDGEVGVLQNNEPTKDTWYATCFVVRGPQIMSAYDTRHEIVLKLPSELRIAAGDEVEVYDKPSPHLYYRGIRVHTLDQPSLFTYNILETTDLTEDRTLANPWDAMTKLPKSVARMVSETHIKRALTAEKCFAEHDFSYYALDYMTPSETFMSALAKTYVLNDDNLNQSAAEFQKKRMRASAAKHYAEEAMTKVEKLQFEKAMSALRKAFPDIGDYRVMIVKDLGESTMALADRNERAIVLSKRTFALGTKFLASTILEEYAHLKTGHADHTRGLQTYLFDSLCTLIENHILGEPL